MTKFFHNSKKPYLCSILGTFFFSKKSRCHTNCQNVSMFQFSTNVPITINCMHRWPERRTDRPYFIRLFPQLYGVQKSKPQVFTQPSQQQYIHPPPSYVKKKIKVLPLLCLSFWNSLSFVFALHLNP